MPITLFENFRAMFYAPFYAAHALDAYAAEGVEVRLADSSNPQATAQRLVSGEADVVWGGPLRVLLKYEDEPDCDFVAFCEVVTRDPFFVIGAMPKPDFQLADLLSCRFASVSEVPTPWICLQDDLRRAGIDPDAVDRIDDGTMADNATALRVGAVDAVQVFQPYAEELIRDGAGHVWYAAADRGPTAYTALYTRWSVIEARRDELLRMTRALHRVLGWVHAHSGEELADVVAGFFPDVPAAVFAGAAARYKALGLWGPNTILPRAGFERLKTAMTTGGLLTRDTTYEEAVDTSLARQVAAEDPPPL
jgi:NitT/TauT family transport system substrate-binding protein